MTPTNRRVPPTATTPRKRRGRAVTAELPSGDTHDAAPDVAPPGAVETRSRFATPLRALFGVAFVVVSSIGIAWFARRYVTTNERFAVGSVQITGNERRSAGAIIAESGIASGVNVFSVDLDAARRAILSDSWIADAELTRRLPHTIAVRVTERRAAALVALGDTLLATSDGEPFKKLEPGDPVDLPIITGLTPETVADDREQARRTIHRGIDLASEYEQGALANRAPLQEVHVDTGGGFTLVVGRSALQLALGGPPFRRKLDEAARVVAELDKRRAQAKAIMLDNDARPERVVARLR